jgi:hypothetical protein
MIQEVSFLSSRRTTAKASSGVRPGPAVQRGLALLAIAATLRAQPSLDVFLPVDGAAPDRVEVEPPKAMNDSGVAAGECIVHHVRARNDGSDKVPPPDHREHFFSQIGGLGTEFTITQVYVLERGQVKILSAPATPGGDPRVVGLNNRRQVLVTRSHQGGDNYYLCDIDSGKFVPIGLAASVDEDGSPRTVRLKYLTGLNDQGEVYGVYDGPLGHCAVLGAPTLGSNEADNPPSDPAPFRFIGSVGKGQLHIVAINAKGQITGVADGRIGFLWSAGKLTRFYFPGTMFTTPEMINDAGLVAGWFRPYNDVKDDGEVANHNQNLGSIPPEKGFVYDGSRFRLVSVPAPGNGSTTRVRAINNAGQLLGQTSARLTGGAPVAHAIPGAFAVEIDQLPLAHMLPTSGDFTAEAIARWRAGPHPAEETGASFDRAYVILEKDVGPVAALSLRVFQLLRSEKPVLRPEKVSLSDSFGNVYNRSLNDFQHDAVGRVDTLFLDQLALAQQTAEGAAAVVEALGAIVGDAQLDDLQAAGSLSDQGVPNERPQERNARRQSRNKLVEDLDTQVGAHPEPWSEPLSGARMQMWQLPEARPEQLAELAEVLATIRDRFGNSAAGTFLACEILRREKSFADPKEANMRQLQLRNLLEAATGDADTLFGLQAVSALKVLQAQGRAEEAIRAVARAPAPASCPALDRLAKGLSPPQSDRLVDRTGHSGDQSELLLEAMGSVEQMALKPFRVVGK